MDRLGDPAHRWVRIGQAKSPEFHIVLEYGEKRKGRRVGGRLLDCPYSLFSWLRECTQANIPGSYGFKPKVPAVQPRVTGEPSFDMSFVLSAHYEEYLRCSLERPANDNEAIVLERIHEGSVFFPTFLSFKWKLGVAASSSHADDRKGSVHR